MMRVVLPPHLRILAQTGREVELEVRQATIAPCWTRGLLSMLRGTIRDQVTRKRRRLRPFAQRDPSHDPTAAATRSRAARSRYWGAIAGGKQLWPVPAVVSPQPGRANTALRVTYFVAGCTPAAAFLGRVGEPVDQPTTLCRPVLPSVTGIRLLIKKRPGQLAECIDGDDRSAFASVGQPKRLRRNCLISRPSGRSTCWLRCAEATNEHADGEDDRENLVGWCAPAQPHGHTDQRYT